MNSIVKYGRPAARAFTMIEMVLALFILCLIVGITIPYITGLISEEKLRDHASTLRVFAITARRLAISENRSYQIHFTEKEFILEPLTPGEEVHIEPVDSHYISSGATYSIERWGEKKFFKPLDESWVFQPGGICEPIRVHFQSGKNWIECSFNPLTATVDGETFSFK